MRPPRATSTQPCCPSASESSAQSTPRTLANRANLASWIGRAGDAVGARDQFAALLPIRERVSGSEYPTPSTLGTTLPTGPRGLRVPRAPGWVSYR